MGLSTKDNPISILRYTDWLLLVLKQVTNLSKQNLLLSWLWLGCWCWLWLWSSCSLLLFLAECSELVDKLNHNEYTDCDDKEVNNLLNESTILPYNLSNLRCSLSSSNALLDNNTKILEVNATHQNTDRGHDDVINQ